MKKIFMGADHAGFFVKEHLKKNLSAVSLYGIEDCGCYNEKTPSDYPDFGHCVCQRVLEHGGKGILICGTGIGMSMVANRYQGIRAALCWCPEVARLARQHNDANVIVMGARVMTLSQIEDSLRAFLETDFDKGRHQARLDKVDL